MFAAFSFLRLLFDLSSQDSAEAEMRCASVELLILVVLGGREADADDGTLVIELEHLHAFRHRDGAGERPALGLGLGVCHRVGPELPAGIHESC